MGSSESTSGSSHKTAQEEARRRSQAEIERQQQREQQQLEAARIEWQQQQIREKHWQKQQFREEQQRNETLLEWRRQQELRQLKLQQENIQKELKQQKIQHQLEVEQLQKQLEKQRLEQVGLEEQRALLQQVQLHQQQFQGRTIAPATGDCALRETVSMQQRAATNVKTIPPKPKETPKSYLTRMSESNVKCTEWSIIDYIKDENFISKEVTENILNLFDDDNTIPFIARYRRYLTQGMVVEKLREVRNSYEQAKLMKQRAISIVKDIEDKGQWTPEFHAFVHETKSLGDLEQIHSIFKTAKSKAAKRAADMGLGFVAEACITGKAFPMFSQLVQESVEGLKTEEQVKDAIVCLMADTIIRDRRTFNVIKKLRSEHPMEIETTKGKGADKLKQNENKYELYYNFRLIESNLRPDQVFAINRGEALKALNVKINIHDKFGCEFKNQCLQQYGFTGSVPSLKRTLIDAAIDFAYNRSIKGSVAKRTRLEIDQRAQNAAFACLAENIKHHLLEPPVRGKVVIGISPGFQKGCKLAVVSEQGNVLETGAIYPHNANNPRGKNEAERALVQMTCKHNCTVFALGNGIASKETEVFLVHVMKNKKIASLDVVYTIVDQSGASIYSCSREAALEFPHVEADIISAVSIARRLQDPMAELVKIEPVLLTADIYQQDLPEKQMAGAIINEIIVEVVSYVGVDANTASVALLKRVAGLNEAKANNIIEWRRSSGPFTNRNDLLKVRGINKRTFEQCAGFFRIVPETAVNSSGEGVPQDSFNCFDRTWIHPESYSVAKSFLEAAKCNIFQLGTSSFLFTLNLYAQTGYAVLAKRFGSTAETMEMIVQGLTIEKGQDIRGKRDGSVFRKSLIRFNDLSNGTVLTGVVTHLAKFGAFVDVGAEIDGLIHTNFMNGLTVCVDQKVEVRVSNISKERGRLGLTLIKCI